jgi:cytochrome P450
VKTVPAIRGRSYSALLRLFFGNQLDMLARFGREAGDIGRFQLGRRSFVLVNTPEYVHEVLVEHAACFHKSPALRIYSRPLLGNGLLTSEDDLHRRQRRLVAPAFNHRRVAGCAGVMARGAERAQEAWADGATRDIAREMMRLTLGIAGETLFGADLLHEADDLGRALTVAMRFTMDQISAPLRLPFAWIPPWRRDVRQAMARLDDTIYGMIGKRRAGGGDTGDLLSMLLLARDAEDDGRMTDKQVRDEAMTLFLAGHETTANALAWTWYLLARHPDVYAKARREVDGALAGRTPAYEDLAGLPYALQVFKEAMRLYPPAYALARQAVRDVKIGDYRVPAGTIVILSPYLLHRKPDYFPDPERFDPERFTPEAEKKLPRYAYLPFGGGPRLCIGNHFALLEGQIVLATLAQRVTLRLAPGQRIEPEPLITLRPKSGIRMIVERRAK